MRREEVGLSQQQMARRLGLKHSVSISNIETASSGIPPKSVKKYAKLLNVSEDTIYDILLEDYENHIRSLA